ncbi:MAG: insulinase family protein [Proteobacteria bacterium]|nr:insulinase family protein [Pseudomonadota bacterium]
MPHVRSVSVGIWVNAGARDESADESGASHFIEHMLFKGTGTRSAFDIATQMDAIGGQSNAFTAMEYTCYHGLVMDTHLARLADILSDIFLNSVFDPEEVERERGVILQEVGMLEDTPEDFLHLLTGQAFYGDHPLGRSILGTTENLARFDSERLKDHLARWYQPDRILVAATGNLEHEQVLSLLAPAFEKIPPGAPLPPRSLPGPANSVQIQGRDLEQVHLCLAGPGLAGTDPRRYAWSIANVILGGNMSSRLFQEIRERRGLAYSVYSFAPAFFDCGMLGVYAAVNPRCVEEALEVIMAELAHLRDKPVSPGELAGAKEYIKGSIYLAAESADNQMLRLAQNEVHFGRYIPLSEAARHIDAVTTLQVQELAAELIRPGSLALALVGPVDDAPDYSSLLSV